ncbi:TetR/AcrR family transcriptional regulator [Nonomuraea sp. NPDC048901]|uniref:TetR/AcrR family transcriptional regulator n=1 Tax=Nonomuraea sp. NPDC048901 TaxID=3155627 RepID=UPI0033F52FC0
MARPKSKDKRDALMAAATRVIVAQGLSAPTAVIAREAGISNGSLFTYFSTKAELFNHLYLELKTGMANASLEGFSVEAPPREQFSRMWSNWTRWATSNPDERRALALLGVSDDITQETRAASQQAMAEVAGILERMRAHGPMRDASMDFAGAIMNSLAEATMDFMVNDPDNADEHRRVGFDALCRMLGC